MRVLSFVSFVCQGQPARAGEWRVGDGNLATFEDPQTQLIGRLTQALRVVNANYACPCFLWTPPVACGRAGSRGWAWRGCWRLIDPPPRTACPCGRMARGRWECGCPQSTANTTAETVIAGSTGGQSKLCEQIVRVLFFESGVRMQSAFAGRRKPIHASGNY